MKFLQKILATSLLVFSSLAIAGLTQPAPVMVDTDNMFAQGDMVSARMSDNEFTFIGCGTRHLLNDDGTTFSYGFCQASVAEDSTVLCFSYDTALVDKMAEANDSSFITFAWNEAGDCTRVGFSTQSFYMHVPEKEDKKIGK